MLCVQDLWLGTGDDIVLVHGSRVRSKVPGRLRERPFSDDRSAGVGRDPAVVGGVETDSMDCMLGARIKLL